MTARMRFERDYYGLMGLSPGATEEEIRRAYRRLALQWHPDRNPGNPEAGDRFKDISEAYAVLIDPAKRQAYDRARASGTTHEFHPDREDLFRDLFANRQASAIFEELAREFERLGMRVDHHHFRQTLFGGRTVITGRVIVITPLTPILAVARLARALLGGGSSVPTADKALPRPRGLLAGLGRAARWFLGVPSSPAAPATAPAPPDDIVLPLQLTRSEAEQGGTRRVALGAGGSDAVLVTIPPRTRSGTRLRLKGRGRPRPDGSSGDVYLAVEIV